MTSHVFIASLKAERLPLPVAEHRFHPTRKWRFDFAWPEYMVALEVEGGVWTKGRHTRASGYIKDMEKYSEAAILGWVVLRVIPSEICTVKTLELVGRALTMQASRVLSAASLATGSKQDACLVSQSTSEAEGQKTLKV